MLSDRTLCLGVLSISAFFLLCGFLSGYQYAQIGQIEKYTKVVSKSNRDLIKELKAIPVRSCGNAI